MNIDRESNKSSNIAFHASDLAVREVAGSVSGEGWRQLMAPLFETNKADIPNSPALEGGLSVSIIGDSVIGVSWFSAQHHVRDQRRVVASGLDQYIVQFFLKGGVRVACGAGEMDVEIGDLLILDLKKVASIFAPAGGRAVWMILPHALLYEESSGRNLHGTIVRSSLPLVSLLRQTLLSLHRNASFVSSDEGRGGEAAAISLLIGAIAPSRLSPILAAPALSVVLRRYVIAYIDEFLLDPQLGVEYLVARFKVSRAHLYRAFAQDGGVIAMIRDRRLDAAYRELTMGRGDSSGVVTQVAHKYLFSSSNQFLRAFRARFSCSPSSALHSGGRYHLRNSAEGIFGHFSDLLKS
ncbi:helix-turn-helix domain-containing protein [Pseudomonas sp. PDM25]|uniref:helix-turn-helix domain-containing protein n=1 Tax=Pseudomonas sp. PDM25 TaxID=2854772 RepID=UPI001C43AD3F|nr:helix-turn-helix domain-containing protein [Pseudomonas sp. PDM25]MBV7515690.1 helix-turn-helix domain-containing protein [Pseudomonas sp. PDM25]